MLGVAISAKSLYETVDWLSCHVIFPSVPAHTYGELFLSILVFHIRFQALLRSCVRLFPKECVAKNRLGLSLSLQGVVLRMEAVCNN